LAVTAGGLGEKLAELCWENMPIGKQELSAAKQWEMRTFQRRALRRLKRDISWFVELS
jgi:hypothetical protein